MGLHAVKQHAQILRAEARNEIRRTLRDAQSGDTVSDLVVDRIARLGRDAALGVQYSQRKNNQKTLEELLESGIAVASGLLTIGALQLLGNVVPSDAISPEIRGQVSVSIGTALAIAVKVLRRRLKNRRKVKGQEG